MDKAVKVFEDTLEFNYALEVGCGQGHITKYFLNGKYKHVHLFDKCETAISKYANSLMDPMKYVLPTTNIVASINHMEKYVSLKPLSNHMSSWNVLLLLL